MKHRIEFYQASLKPSSDRANLTTLWQVSLAIVVVWGLVFTYAGLTHYQLGQQNTTLQMTLAAKQHDAEQLRATLSVLQGRQDGAERSRIEQNIKARQQLLSLLSQQNLVSYANTLNDLAHIPWDNVALQGLTLQGEQMVLRGEAVTASAVPAWILGFNLRSSLRGHRFGQLAITQPPEGDLTFSLYSTGITP
ncbi:fimbrial assembly protein [Oceanisphaera pacifica]|uniref:Fimbrial assembly protein n=1 Tax=Oceanisphaera pacifica TaxID=2818389 RepID=A0ABS3NE40_9GAMM|nr:fimbrial assembly protein [Oceanisphaera pacifica]MBO1518757.1 fimbrial assembly protein [Oceanisphaera pacifica]